MIGVLGGLLIVGFMVTVGLEQGGWVGAVVFIVVMIFRFAAFGDRSR